MSGLEQVKAAIAKALEQAGTAARAAYAPGWARSYEEPVVAVGLRMGESRGGAMGGYLGEQVDPETLACREIYGMRLELTLSLDIYSPPGLGAGQRPGDAPPGDAGLPPLRPAAHGAEVGGDRLG